jgi:hypothetical protein
MEGIGADHGLRKKQNQKDYQNRILAWFGHYLKDEPAEDWSPREKVSSNAMRR